MASTKSLQVPSHRVKLSVVFEEDTNDKMLPFTFDISESSLVYVDSEETLKRFERVIKGTVLIGIDTETKPNFIRNIIRHPTSLLQIAVRMVSGDEYVFIVDLLCISKNSTLMKHLELIIVELFENKECIKFGQGLPHDFSELCLSYKTTSFTHAYSVLDTSSLVKELQPDILHTLSLKTLVKQYLNCNLVKTQQMSDWSRRPLMPNQIHYAACDALVLLRLYDAMCCEAEEMFSVKYQREFNVKNFLCEYQYMVSTKKKKLKTASTNTTAILCPGAAASISSSCMYTKKWSSTSAKQWHNSVVSTNKNQSSAKSDDNMLSKKIISDDDETCTLPLPKGEGIHTVFSESSEDSHILAASDNAQPICPRSLPIDLLSEAVSYSCTAGSTCRCPGAIRKRPRSSSACSSSM